VVRGRQTARESDGDTDLLDGGLYYKAIVADSPAETGGDGDADPDTKGIYGGRHDHPQLAGRQQR
jgi:hypothetical protein